MFELLVAAGMVAGLFGLRFLHDSVSPGGLLLWSAGLVAAGFAVGLPAGAVYHVLLARALAARGRLAKRWWLRPASYHSQLDEPARRRVMPWFHAGAAGFLLVAAGCVLLFALAVRVSAP